MFRIYLTVLDLANCTAVIVILLTCKVGPYIVLRKILAQVSRTRRIPDQSRSGVKIDDERVSDELLMSSNL